MNFQKVYQNISRKIAESNGSPIEYDLKPYEAILQEINGLGAKFEHLPDQALQDEALQLKVQLSGKASPDSILVEAFALCREVCHRVLGMRPYDVQLLAGLAMYHGKLAEMKTGEGKTLAAVLPAYLQALSGKGVHVLTFNDYLAKRDAEWMAPVYEFLGLSVGYIQQDMLARDKKNAYSCDVTYATAKEVGFDYLRSFIAYSPDELILRPFHFAIVDEADALLIDEARNPLVLAGNIRQQPHNLPAIARFVAKLEPEVDYQKGEYERNVFLSALGSQKAEKRFKANNLYDPKNKTLLTALNLALQAKALLHKDLDYVVKGEQIMLIDEFTGRMVEDRKWQNGLQAAVEAKEGVPIQIEGQVLNSITLPHLIHQYPHLAGMTATAQLSADEFADFYGLKTVVIPPNITSQRIDHPDSIFTHKAAKLDALVTEIKTVHQIQRPVLVGTLSVSESEEIAGLLAQEGIRCTVLNAKQDAHEAEVVANAGALGAITIATNMAGRGTDIVLGGKHEETQEQVRALGGLHVIGTNRHESRRIDDQLKGRAGRQGDPGSTHFMISFEDHLMQKYALKTLLPKKYRDLKQTAPLTQTGIVKGIAQAQRVIEGQMHYMRKTLYEYSAFVEKQRQILHQERQLLLQGASFTGVLKEYLLNQYDRQWSNYLNDIAQIKEGIYWARMAGKMPLHSFWQQAGQAFDQLQYALDTLTEQARKNLLEEKEWHIKKPSSTWTYVVNDNPLGNEIGMAIAGNLGLQVDFFSLPALLVMGMVRKWRSKKQE
ncbi:DEAD/DEAH box helicase [uncultured Microscilla sp.]|uniref:preprotein translocase subunit SecA n=1 Tax=uncultured Microscilla sp. TaxID=432653 RepID=UPI00260AC5B1|nr:DEAD/DEAH box helicase [uncultured Microscilla sp.]